MSETLHEDQDEKQSRRDFLRSLARYSILGILASTTGVLVTRRKGWFEDCPFPEEKRVSLDICQSCKILEKCDLPEALAVKEKTAGDKYARRER